ncbi:MAG: CHASE3 domain-containing protein [Bryobacteraceae bacterium]
MNLTFAQMIRFGFWLLTIIPIVLGVVAFRNANALVDAAKDVAHTNEVVTILEQVLSSAKDLEVAQREFILTGDDRHVAAIKQYRVGLADVLEKLRELKADDYSLTLLEDIIPQKFQEIEKTIDLRQKQGIEAASLEILANRGALAMDDLRAVVRTMIQQENHLLDQRTRTQGLRFNRTFTIIAIVLVLNVALLWSVRYVWAREDRQIRKLNEQLEQRVARRGSAATLE